MVKISLQEKSKNLVKKETAGSEKMAKIFEKNKELFDIPKKGDILKGKILEITNNAIYIDLGPLGTGVVVGREIFDDKDTFKKAKIGNHVKASVIESENENGLIELSLKKASRDRAWEILKERLEKQETFPTKILEANRGGLIIRVAGIVGFLPVSQLSIKRYPRVEGGNKDEILNRLSKLVGQEFEVQVIDVDPNEEKLIVSEKAVNQEKLEKKVANLKIGQRVEGKITGVVDFGAFTEFNGLEGLIHISELAWERINNPRDVVKPGDKVKAEIISIDGTRVSLSLKRLQKDPWQKAVKKYKVGDTILGKVIKITPFGLFIEIEKNFHGLAHSSELSDNKEKMKKIKIGKKKKFKIISIEPESRKLGLSLKLTKTKKKKTKAK